jgi:hypothetical protein
MIFFLHHFPRETMICCEKGHTRRDVVANPQVTGAAAGLV